MTAARGELERLGVPHRRPEDFLAEMMKSDDHMAKASSLDHSTWDAMLPLAPPALYACCDWPLPSPASHASCSRLCLQIKDRLITEQKRMSAVDSRRKQRDSLKYLKQVAAEKAKSKAADRRAHDETLKQWRKHRGDAEHAATDFEAALSGKGKAGGGGGGAAAGGPGGGAAGGGGAGGPRGDRDRERKSGRRKAKDSRYGFGGPKRFKKDNTAGSSRDTKSFSVARNKALPPGIKFKGGRPGGAGGAGGGSAGGKGAGRPGKRARVAGKSSKGSGRR